MMIRPAVAVAAGNSPERWTMVLNGMCSTWDRIKVTAPMKNKRQGAAVRRRYNLHYVGII